MELATALDHSAQHPKERVVELDEEMEHEKKEAPRRQKTPPPGVQRGRPSDPGVPQ